MSRTDTAADVNVLRTWIHQALILNGYVSMTGTAPLEDNGTHGMYSPVEYTLHNEGGSVVSTLNLRGLVVGKKYMLYCERSSTYEADASNSTWRVDFPLTQYVPSQASLFPRYQAFVAWRVKNSVVQHGSSAAQALLHLVPSPCLDSVVSFLDVASLCALRASNKTLYQHAMTPSVWAVHLRRGEVCPRAHLALTASVTDFPSTPVSDPPSFAAYANASINRTRIRQLRNRAMENMLWFDREAGPAYAQRWLAPPPLARPQSHIPRLPFEAPSS